jgi:hypothetical protein
LQFCDDGGLGVDADDGVFVEERNYLLIHGESQLFEAGGNIVIIMLKGLKIN